MTPPDVDQFRDALKAVYYALDAEVQRLEPVCAISGRCCRFEEYGHTLFLSQPEFDLLLADAPPPVRPLDDGLTCPWQDLAGRCTARDARPLGCRVYFCDPAYQPMAPELAEAAIQQTKRLVEERSLPWNYAPLSRHLGRAKAEGRLPDLEEKPPATPRMDSDVEPP